MLYLALERVILHSRYVSATNLKTSECEYCGAMRRMHVHGPNSSSLVDDATVIKKWELLDRMRLMAYILPAATSYSI
jgi:hypothetical protein